LSSGGVGRWEVGLENEHLGHQRIGTGTGRENWWLGCQHPGGTCFYISALLQLFLGFGGSPASSTPSQNRMQLPSLGGAVFLKSLSLPLECSGSGWGSSAHLQTIS
jgi:hypothetical protein